MLNDESPHVPDVESSLNSLVLGDGQLIPPLLGNPILNIKPYYKVDDSMTIPTLGKEWEFRPYT